jgi:hexokinase
VGLEALAPATLRETASRLRQEIQLGLNRTAPPTEEDGGLFAIRNPVRLPPPNAIAKIPVGTAVIAGAFAGTNWEMRRIEFQGINQPMTEAVLLRRRIGQNERRFSDPQAFINFMADVVSDARRQAGGEVSPTLAVALGFGQKNVWRECGLDAQFLRDDPAKFWFIPEGRDVPLGGRLLSALKERGIEAFEQVIFANDTVAAALDRTAAPGDNQQFPLFPGGFVFGTGSNGCLEYQDRIVNLETGRSQALGHDPITTRMMGLHLVPDLQRPLLEYHTGGDYLKARFAAALDLAHKRCLLKENFCPAVIASRVDSRMVSDLAGGQIDRNHFYNLTGAALNAAQFQIIQAGARGVMTRAAQVAGIMIGAVLQEGGWSQGAVPVEGTVFWHGQCTPGIAFPDVIGQTLRQLTPDSQLSFVRASGLRGVATYAMTRPAPIYDS